MQAAKAEAARKRTGGLFVAASSKAPKVGYTGADVAVGRCRLVFFATPLSCSFRAPPHPRKGKRLAPPRHSSTRGCHGAAPHHLVMIGAHCQSFGTHAAAFGSVVTRLISHLPPCPLCVPSPLLLFHRSFSTTTSGWCRWPAVAGTRWPCRRTGRSFPRAATSLVSWVRGRRRSWWRRQGMGERARPRIALWVAVAATATAPPLCPPSGVRAVLIVVVYEGRGGGSCVYDGERFV